MKTKFYSGSAIILTVLGIAAMTTVALGVAQLVPRDFRQSQALEASLQAENAAWAGVEHALLLLKTAQESNKFFSLSESVSPPYGSYLAGKTNCMNERSACPGFDRQLGNLQNGQPVNFEAPLMTPDSSYSLVVWHKREGVGNTGPGGLDDYLGTSQNMQKDAPNINPVLDRDEVRRLDIDNVTSVTINWKPVWNTRCQYDGGRTKMWLYYSVLGTENQILTRGFKEATESTGLPISLGTISKAHTLSLRLLATNTTNLNPQATDDEARVSGCFIRYNLDMGPRSNETIDLGFDVVESTGVSGGVRRKIRVIVNRENGRLLNILDFGIACETCTGLD